MKKRLVILAIVFVISAPIIVFFTFPGAVYRATISAERCRAGLSEKSIRVDDHRIVYLEGGKGPTVLLIHGFAAEKDYWTRFSRFITPSYHVIILDLPGFGESARIDSARYDVASQVARLERFADLLKLDRFHVAGNSMGGNIACYLAAQDRARVASLAIFDGSGVKPPKKSGLQLEMEKGKNPLLADNEEDYDRIMKLGFSKPPWIPGPVRRYFAQRAVAARPFNQKIGQELRQYPVSLEPMLGRIRVPSLILWGDDDRILDVSAVSVFERGLARHKTVIMKKCGHVPMLERPEETAKHYLEFLAGQAK